MNQQLKELAELARKQSTESTIENGEVFDYDCFCEKFAELIIQKCLEECQAVAYDADKKANSSLVTDAGSMLYEGMWGGAKNCAGQIKYYFGIKE